MGTLRSSTDVSGMVVNGVVLGWPVTVDVDGVEMFAWDDAALPSGEIVNGDIVPDGE